MSTSVQFSVKALLDKMKSLVFILSLLLILERQAAVVGQYGGFTKGGFTKGGFTSSSSGFMKGHVSYGLKGGSEDAAQESAFLQTKQQAYSKGGSMQQVQQARLSQEHTGVKGAALCRKGQTSQIKSQESQIKSFGQAKSLGSQVKSYGQMKSYGQVKSQQSQVKSYGQMKSQNAQLKSYGQLKSQDAQLKSYGQLKSFGEDAQLKSYAQQKSQVAQQAFSQAKSQSGQLKSFGQLKSQSGQLKSFGQLKSQSGQLKSFGQTKSLKGFSQQTQQKGFAMGGGLSQVRKQYDDDTSVQQKSSQQVKTEQDLSQFGQQRQFGQERSQSYKGYLEQYQKKSQDNYQQRRNFNGGGYFTKGGEGLYTQLKS
ncbi:semenogelin-1 [Peromyscus leucopus]|uniref:semenogelin-1 n=1 Tax=Peromyscus leucopus TaxID=10041 RepID=UPI001884F100|nr:semenogelin-1 [Peromyscus leucopus]